MITPATDQPEDTSVNDQAEAEQVKKDSLPGAPRLDGNINWLGSSFSGVDVKVIAHLYGKIEIDEELERLKEQQQLNQRIADACLELAGNVDSLQVIMLTADPDRLTSSELGQEVLVLAGVRPEGDEIAQQAGIFVLQVFRQTPPGPQFFQYLRTRLLDFSFSYQKAADSLGPQIEKRTEISKNASSTIVLATLQTLSLQTHREKYAVRALGSSYAKGYTRGPRTIAGSMVFTMFNEHALARLIRAMSGKATVYGERDTEISSLIADQLPPIDLTIAIANEYGQLSQMGIYGVEFVNDGMTMSVEDILTEEVVQFIARDCDVLTSSGNIRLLKEHRAMHFNDDGTQDQSATSLLFSSDQAYSSYIDKLKVRRRLLNR
jgi:hypothetical protein